MPLTAHKDDVHITVVSPVYKAERIVDELVRQLTEVLSTITDSFEIILVEDGGPDNSWQKIMENCARDPRVKGIKLSRNFGQHHAITAGLDYCNGEWVIVMDCDLQDQPKEIPGLYAEAQKGYDIVFARRINRQDKFIKRITSSLFYKTFSYLSGTRQDGTIANYGIFSRKVIDSINTLREPMRSFTTMSRWVGFNKTTLDVSHGERYEGKTSYSWSKLIDFALEIIISYSQKPLRMAVKLGLFISFLSVVFTIYTFIRYLQGAIWVTGYTSLIISIWFLSGLIIFILGIVGLYIGKIFDGIKQRPIYIVDKNINI